MRYRIILLLCFCFPFCLMSQHYTYTFSSVKMDSNYMNNKDLTLQYYIENYKGQIAEQLDVVIGNSTKELKSFSPQSPLSNLLTDLLLEYGQQMVKDNEMIKNIDFSFLNFGGIRASIPQGKITIGTIFTLMPFDNTVALVSITGKDLYEVLQGFTEKSCLPSSGLEIKYRNGRFLSATIGQQPIEADQVYHFITNSYLADGGESIMPSKFFTDVVYAQTLIRDVFIYKINERSKLGLFIDADIDERAVPEIHQR